MSNGSFEAERERVESLRALDVLDTDSEERFDRITRLAADHFDCSGCLISLVDSDRQWFKSSVGVDEHQTPRESSFCSHAILEEEAFIVEDARKDTRFHDNPLVTGKPFIVFYAGFQIHSSDGNKVGTFCIFDDKPRKFSTKEKRALHDFTAIAEKELNDLSQIHLLKVNHEMAVRTDLMLSAHPDTMLTLDNHLYCLDVQQNHDDPLFSRNVIGKPISSFLPSDIAASFCDSINQVFDSGEPVRFNVTYCSNDKSSFFEVRAKRITENKVLVILRDVTEEQEKLDQLEQLSMVTELTINGVMITDTERKLIWINKGFTKLSGFSEDEVIGKSPESFLQGPETSNLTLTRMQRALENGQGFSSDMQTYGKDGSQYWVQVSCNPWRDDTGKLKGFIAVLTDISERMQNLEEIKKNQKLLNAVVDANSIGTWVANLQTGSVEVNKYWASLLGYRINELEPIDMKTWEQLTHPDDLKACISQLERYDKGLIEYYEASIRMKHKDGHWHWIRTRGSISTRTNDGRAEFLVGTHTDVHAQILAEEALGKQSEYMQLIYHKLPVGVVIHDAQDKIQLINPMAKLIFGYSDEQIVNANMSLLAPEIPSAQSSDQQFLTIGKRQNGEQFPMETAIIESELNKEKITVVMLRDVGEREKAKKEIHQLAYYDILTGLPNRQLLHDSLNQVFIDSFTLSHNAAILFIDFDNFKQINDFAGHHVGDQLLQQIAERIKLIVRETDFIARFGGDEFVVILHNLDENALKAVSQAETIAKNIQKRIAEPYRLGEVSYSGSASIGITLCQSNIESPDVLLKQADIAMYDAKSAGKDAIRVFESEMLNKTKTRIGIEQDLHQAIQNEEFKVYYQMQVDNQGLCIGAEALLRWFRPDKGFISPVDFIPVAEDSGLIIPLGRWVLEQTCMQLSKWSGHPGLSKMIIAVNVSVNELYQSSWVEDVTNTITRYGIDPCKLKLEVTESVMAVELNEVIRKLSKIRELGVCIALDDFGTGYSSLSYLKTLPLDQLKIDRSFVRDLFEDPHDKAIAQTIINLAKTMELKVIAEGIETKEQLGMLRDMGCREFQGYYFSKPLPLEEFEALALERII